MSAHVHAIPDAGLGNTSYIVDVGDGLALSVDPPRDAERHLAAAERLGLRIVASVETHLHADFVSGSRELAEAVGADVIAPAEGAVSFPHQGVRDGQVVTIGRCGLEVLATPGHTPEHVSYLIGDALFTGGSLIAGGAARTDLISPDQTVELSRLQFRSLQRLASLPATTAVHPTHGAGSFCVAGPAPVSSGTLGQQMAANPLLTIDDEDEFIRRLMSGFGSFPPYFLRLREINRTGPALLSELGPPLALDPLQVQAAVDAGAWLIDARPIAIWAAAHPVGSISIELRAAFASWLGWVVPFASPVVLLIDDDDTDEALRQARSIGYDAILGSVAGGIDAWIDVGLPVASTEAIAADEAHRRKQRGVPMVDVRQTSELKTARIPGALHIELGDILAGTKVAGPECITFCGHGERSATAASILERHGVKAANLVGGTSAWEAEGFAIDR